MTQEDRELLLKDLCARIPYKVKCLVNYTFCNETTDYEDVKSSAVDTIITIEINQQIESYLFERLSEWFTVDEFKPYLFPLSSIKTTFDGALETSDSKSRYSLPDFWRFSPNCIGIKDNEDPYINICDMNEFFDWCNQNHIDYRGWIEKGLAIDATNLNIY